MLEGLLVFMMMMMIVIMVVILMMMVVVMMMTFFCNFLGLLFALSDRVGRTLSPHKSAR